MNPPARDMLELCVCGHEYGTHSTRPKRCAGQVHGNSCPCPRFRAHTPPVFAGTAPAETIELEAVPSRRAAPPPASSRPLLTEEEYERKAFRILSAFEGVCSFPETRGVLAMRLREAVEGFIARKGGSAWGELVDLMCAFQKLQAKELEARERELAAPKNGGRK